MSHAPVTAMLEQIRSSIYERTLQGSIDYPRDLKTLQKHLEVAQAMNDNMLVGRTLNVMGIVEQYMGHDEQALQCYEQAYRHFALLPDLSYMSRTRNNIGEMYRLSGRYTEAITSYQEALAILIQHDDANSRRSYALIESNIGLALLAIGEYSEAETHFQKFIASVAAETWQHVDALVEARCGLAEIYRAKQDFRHAWENANEALRLATERGHHVVLAEIHLTRAHIAEDDPQSPHSADYFYQLGHAEFAQQTSRLNIARSLYTEAQYQQRRGKVAAMRQFASQAQMIYEELGMEAHAQRAATLAN